MSRPIYKYEIPIRDRSVVRFPRGYGVVDVQVQRDKVVLWAVIDPKAPVDEETAFRFIMTGENLPDDTESVEFIHVRTLTIGSLVYHLFVEQEKEECGSPICTLRRSIQATAPETLKH